MSKRKPLPSPDPGTEVCGTCNDTGQVCLGCGRADGDCTCPGGPELDACPDCGGRP